MKTTKTVLAYGETLWDLLPTGAVLGGAPFNFAYRVNSLGNKGLIVSRLGKDDLGRKAFAKVAEVGMDTSFIQWDDEMPTGTVEVTLDENSNPDYNIVPSVAYDRIEVADALVDLAASADCFCFGTLIQRSATARATLRALLDVSPGSLKLLDINLRKHCHTPETIALSLDEADILKLNDDEARYLGDALDIDSSDIGDFCRRMMERFRLSHCLVTLGERGAYAASSDSAEAYVPGYKVDVVDPCGSGDAFSAGFLHLCLAGRPLAECCRLANAMGAIVATQKGATAPIDGDRIVEFMDSNRKRIVEPALKHVAAV